MEFDFLKPFFGRPGPESSELDVPNVLGLGDGSPFCIQRNPDLPAIFGSDHPEAPFRTPQSGWSVKSVPQKHVSLAAAYSNHPSAPVRLQVVELMRGEESLGMSQILVNLLADPAQDVRTAAARCLWEWHGGSACRFAVLALRDEIRGYTEMVKGHQSSEGLFLGHEAAVTALDFLVAAAPTPEHRLAIEKLVRDEVIIEERIADVDTRSMKYVGKESKGIYTYEVYRAKNRQQALAFLKRKSVSEENYYIEVETVEGNFGRDIKGIYEV